MVHRSCAFSSQRSLVMCLDLSSIPVMLKKHHLSATSQNTECESSRGYHTNLTGERRRGAFPVALAIIFLRNVGIYYVGIYPRRHIVSTPSPLYRNGTERLPYIESRRSQPASRATILVRCSKNLSLRALHGPENLEGVRLG